MKNVFMPDAHIKTLDVSFLYDDKEFSSYYSQMPDYRKKKIDFFKFKKDKCLSLGAGILMNQLILYAKKQSSSLNDDSFTVDFSKNGKPFFKFLPFLNFSLAHSGKMVIAALSTKKIGVDVEEETDESEIDFKTWTKAESYIKALDLPLSDYIEGKIPLPPENSFRQWTENGYIFCVYED